VNGTGACDPLEASSAADDDGAIIGRSRNEPEQFAVLFRRHAVAISRYATRRLGPQLAEDIVAETFLTAFRERSRYDPARTDAMPWLHGIAANLIRRHHRNEVRWLRALARTGCDPIAQSPADLAEDRLTADTVGRAVAAALAALSARHREVVLLVAWAELTYDQAAEALGVPAGTVRSRMNRARQQLRRSLADVHSSQQDRSQEVSHA
jgi:RNA polymerase sigma factor (sigma-70 family)